MIRSIRYAAYAVALGYSISAVAIAQEVKMPSNHQIPQAPSAKTVVSGTSSSEEYSPSAGVLMGRRYATKAPDAPMFVADDPITTSFYVRNQKTGITDDVTGVLWYESNDARIWVDSRDTTRLKGATFIKTLYKALDTVAVNTNAPKRNSTKGILENDIEVFGPPPTKYLIEGKTDFLLTDIQDPVAGSNILGYFSSFDQTDQPGSNTMNLLYIDDREGAQNITSLLNTVAHEFQHLLHYARRPQSETVFNEGLSENASLLNGYFDRPNAAYMANTNIDFFTWHYTESNAIEIDYERAQTFVHYLHEQFGEQFLFNLVGSQATNMDRVADALQKSGFSISVNDVLANFGVANLLQRSSNPVYGYKFTLSSNQSAPNRAKPQKSYTGSTFATTQSVTLAPYGTSYIEFKTPGSGLQVKTDPGSTFRVTAVGIKGTDTVITPIVPGTEYTLSHTSGEAYDRIVLAFTSLVNGEIGINLTTAGVTLGVEDLAAAVPAGISQMLLDPSMNSATVGYSLARNGMIRMDVFDSRGVRVATPIEGELKIAGEYRTEISLGSLPSGYYTIRLSSGGSVASTHPLVIAR